MAVLLTMLVERRCTDCRKPAPDTDTAHTLISGKHQWRLSRRMEGQQWINEWRCPDCWRRYKARQSDAIKSNVA